MRCKFRSANWDESSARGMGQGTKRKAYISLFMWAPLCSMQVGSDWYEEELYGNLVRRYNGLMRYNQSRIMCFT